MSEIKFKSQFASRKAQDDKVFQKIISGDRLIQLATPINLIENDKYKSYNQQKLPSNIENSFHSTIQTHNHKFLENNETAKYEPKVSQYADVSYNRYAPSKSENFSKNYDISNKVKDTEIYIFNNEIKKEIK